MPFKDGIDITAVERRRRHEEKACSIDEELEAAYAKIDWNRRNSAEKSLV